MFKLLVKKTDRQMTVFPGDKIVVRYRGQDGRTEEFERPIETAAVYTTLAVGEIENELGFKNGLVAVIGN